MPQTDLVRYSGPYRKLYSAGDVLNTTFRISHGFTELRSGDVTVASLPAGCIFGGGRWTMFDHVVCGGSVLQDIHQPDEIAEGERLTADEMARWLITARCDTQQRVYRTLKHLARWGEGPVQITQGDLGRLCGLSRLWVGKALSELYKMSDLRSSGHSKFSFMSAATAPRKAVSIGA